MQTKQKTLTTWQTLTTRWSKTPAETTDSTCHQCHHTFQSPSKVENNQTDIQNQCQHVVKDHTCEHCHGSFESEKGLQRHVQRKQDASVLIQELKAAHKEELDQVQQEKAMHKEELIKVQQDLAIAATTVLDLQNILEAATRTPEAVSEAVSEAAERRLMQKLIDIQQNLTNVGRGCEDIKAVVCPETSVHHALAPASTLSKSERLDNLKQTAINVEAVKPHDAENTLQETATGVGQVTRDTDCPAVSSGDVMNNHAPCDDYPVADMNLNSVVWSAFEAPDDHTPLLTIDLATAVLQAASPTTDTDDPELRPSDFSIAMTTLHEPMPTPSCMSLAGGASETLPKDQTYSQHQRAFCKEASKDQLNSEAAESCGLSVPAENAAIDIKDLGSLMNVPIFDAHSDAKADATRHLEDRAETSQTQQAPHEQVALEHATDAELLLSAERRTETSASTTRSQRQSRCAPFPYNKFKHEDCDWTSHDCKQVKKMLGIKQGKKEPWLPDSCVVVNLPKDIHCNQKCPQNWNILLPSIDSPIVWVSNGKAFNEKATGLMMYQLIGQLALHLGSLQDKLR